ncbi:hypothetical protein KC921_03520 [Candidatus Woesebacteria bacterium]|nr:hypothetical protein [Candidatus Woesebacteria bacterium]
MKKKKTSGLPASLTEVTTVSKILAAVLFISLPILSFYLGFMYCYLNM